MCVSPGAGGASLARTDADERLDAIPPAMTAACLIQSRRPELEIRSDMALYVLREMTQGERRR
jgi:hypothetical protein